MAGGVKVLAEQSFSSTSTIVFNHGLGITQLQYRIIVGGRIRGDLIVSGTISSDFNTATIVLASAESGVVQALENEAISVPTFSFDEQQAIGSSGETFKISSDDTTSGYAEDKITAGNGIDVNVNNPGGNENIQIVVDASEINHQNLNGAGVNTHPQVDAHIASLANPHSVTAAQVGNTTPQWNANQIRNKTVQSGSPTNNQILKFNSTSDQWEYTTDDTGTGAGLILSSNVAWVDTVNGNNGTGAVGDLGLPFLTIKAAHDAISAGQVVIVRPGSYSEQPFIVGVDKTILSEGGPEATTLDSINLGGNRITLSNGSVFKGFTVILPNDANPAIDYSGSGEAYLDHITLQGNGASGNGIRCNGTGRINVDFLQYKSGTADKVIEMISGNVHIRNFHFHSGTAADAFNVSGGEIFIENIHLSSSGITDGFHLSGGRVFGGGLRTSNLTNTFHVTSNSCEVGLVSGTLNSATWDLLIDSGLTTSTFHLTSFECEEEKFSIPSTWLFDDTLLLFQDEKVGDKGFKHWGEVNVGVPEKGFETVMGEGDSYTRGMVVLTTDSSTSSTTDGGNLTDVSSSASSKTGSTFGFQGTAAGHSILIGSSLFEAGGADRLRHWGLKIAQVTAAVEITEKSFAVEIWDGSAWVEIGAMTTESGKFFRYANTLFIRANSSEHLRYGITDETAWSKKTINSQNLYWSRIRITDSLTTSPTFEQFKISCSRFEANADGTNTFHGLSRFRQTLFSSGNVFGEEGGVTDANASVGSGGVPTGWTHRIKNSLLNGNGDNIMTQLTLPRGIDTSQPLSLSMIYKINTTNNSGNGTFIISVLPVEVAGNKIADPAGGINPIARSKANTETLTSKQAQFLSQSIDLDGSSGGNNKFLSLSFDSIDISDYYEGDILLIRLELDEDGDPANDVLVYLVEVGGVNWTHGEKL